MWGLKLSFQVRQLPQLLYPLQNALWSWVTTWDTTISAILLHLVIKHTSSLLHKAVTISICPANSSKSACFYFILEMNSYIFFSLMWSQCSFVCTSQVIAVYPHLLVKYRLGVPIFLTWSGEVCRLELGHPPSWWWNSTHWFPGKSGCTVVPNSVRAFHCWSAVSWT